MKPTTQPSMQPSRQPSAQPTVQLTVALVKKLGAGLKVLATGDLKRKITVRAHKFSEAAVAKIQAAGGVAEVIEAGKK